MKFMNKSFALINGWLKLICYFEIKQLKYLVFQFCDVAKMTNHPQEELNKFGL